MNSKLLNSIIKFDLDLCGISHQNTNELWTVGIHQIRIFTSGNEVLPAPEGIHSDGHNYLVIHLINRYNISGGICTIYDKNETKINEGMLLNRWDSLVLNDNNLKHGISSVYPTNSNDVGFRDVLIIDLKYTS